MLCRDMVWFPLSIRKRQYWGSSPGPFTDMVNALPPHDPDEGLFPRLHEGVGPLHTGVVRPARSEAQVRLGRIPPGRVQEDRRCWYKFGQVPDESRGDGGCIQPGHSRAPATRHRGVSAVIRHARSSAVEELEGGDTPDRGR